MAEKPEATVSVDRRHLDRGWSWVVLTATFLAFFIMQGQLLTGNIYFIIYLQEFRQPRSVTAFTGAAYTAAVNLTGPLSSVLLRKFGPRFLLMFGGLVMSSGFLCIFPTQTIGQVIFASGVIRGIGASFIMTGCQASLSKYFCKRLYVATGIMYSASAIGMMTIGLMTEYVVGAYGWRGSMIIQAGLTLHVCLCGALVFKIPGKNRKSARETDGEVGATSNVLHQASGSDNRVTAKRRKWPWQTRSEESVASKNPESPLATRSEDDEASKNLLGESKDGITNGTVVANDQKMAGQTGSEGNTPANRRRPSPKEYMRDVRFWCISGCTTMLFMFTTVVIIFWKDILPYKNHFKVAVVAMAVGSTLGRATAGFVSSRIAPPLHNCAVCTANALVILGFLVSDSVWTVAAHNFAWGFLNGQQTVADRLQLAWVFGRLDMPVVLGYSLIFVGIGGFMAPPLAGFITDSTGKYLGTLLMTSAFSLTGASLSLLLYFIHKKRLKQETLKDSGPSIQSSQ